MLTRFYRLFVALLLVLAAPVARAQDAPPAGPPPLDVLIDLNGNEMAGQVIEITPTHVAYRPVDSDPTLPPTLVEKQTLFMVRFANGTRELMTPPRGSVAPAGTTPAGTAPTGLPPSSDGLTIMEREQLRQRGANDAYRYSNRTGPFLGSMFGVGLGTYLPPIIIGVIPPRARKNHHLDPQLLNYPTYVQGYEDRARKRKTGAVLGGSAVGLGLLVLLLSAINNP